MTIETLMHLVQKQLNGLGAKYSLTRVSGMRMAISLHKPLPDKEMEALDRFLLGITGIEGWSTDTAGKQWEITLRG